MSTERSPTGLNVPAILSLSVPGKDIAIDRVSHVSITGALSLSPSTPVYIESP